MASMAGEDLFGIHDHRGCGSDIAQARYFSRLYLRYFSRGEGSVDSILYYGYSRAKGLLTATGMDNLEREAMEQNLSDVA